MSSQEATIELPKYKCHKEVWALKIKELREVPPIPSMEETQGDLLLVPEDSKYSPFFISRKYIDKHNPQVGGYYVVYQDGYKSYSPAKAFEEGYTLVE